MRLTLRHKLLISFACIVAMTGALGYAGISSAGSSNEALKGFADRPYTQVSDLQTISYEIMRLRRALLAMPATETDEEIAAVKSEYAEAWKSIDGALESFDKSITAGSRRQEVADLRASMEALRPIMDKSLDLSAAVNPNFSSDVLVEGAEAAAQIAERLAALDAAGAAPPAMRLAIARLRENTAAIQLAMISTIDLADEAKSAEQRARIDAIDASTKSALGALTEAGAGAVDGLEADWDKLRGFAAQQAVLGLNSPDEVATQFIAATVQPASAQVTDQINASVTRAREVADTYLSASQASYESTRSMLIAFVLAAVAIGAAAAFWLASIIHRGLSRSVSAAETIGSGNLARRIDAHNRDEIGDLLTTMERMRLALRGIVGDVLGSAGQVASGSALSAQTAEQLSSGSSEQAAASEQASAAVEEMSANVRQNAENASTTEKIAAQANVNAEKTGAAVAQSVEAMRTIAEKITVVQEIARQTDLLALNAAIEAARAGAHGKGFAVVASEVRKLAERSQAAAEEIGELSASTLHVSEEAGRMLESLVPDIRRTAELVGEISAACREQSIGIEQINQAIQQLDQVTQANAGAANEMSATAEQLSSEAGRLESRAGFFRLEDGALPRPDASPAPAPASDVRALQRRAEGYAAGQPSPKPAAKRKPAASGVDLDLQDGDAGFERLSA